MNYKVRRTSYTELYHSDSFLGIEFSDELYHWKYIKKKKVNGKWRYYYDKEQLKDDLGFDERKRYKDAKRERKYYWEQENKYLDNFKSRMDYINRDPQGVGVTSPEYDTVYKMANKDHDIGMEYRKDRERVDKKVNQFYNEYRRTPIGKIDEIFAEPIRNAKTLISDWSKRVIN